MRVIFEDKNEYHTATEKKYLPIAYKYHKKNGVNLVKVNRKTFFFEDETTIVIDPIEIESGYKGKREKISIID